jgi:hypothetical protein
MKCYYASHRRYHEKFSGRIEQVAANLFLRVGLIGRIVVYTLWYRLTNNKEIADRLHWFSEVHRNWSRLLL